jgi:hypothetical protein
MSIAHAVPLKDKIFTEEHLELSKKYICPDVYPGLYQTSELPKGVRYVGRVLKQIKDITIELDDEFERTFMTQGEFIRANGRGINADDVQSSMKSQGFKLNHIPISIALCHNKQEHIVDGRSRLHQLVNSGFTNVIVDVYECDNWDAFSKMTQINNNVADPYSPHTKSDIISNCNHAVTMGWIKQTYQDIKDRVMEIAPNSFKPATINKIVLNVLNGTGHTSKVLAFSEATAKQWLNNNGYHDGNGIYYKVVSTQFYSKAITVAAKYLQRDLMGCNVKELRIVLHTDTLDGADPEKSWKDKTDTFRVNWDRSLTEIRDTFFSDGKLSKPVKLFGVIPAVQAMQEIYPMDRLVMFHVGDLKDKTFAEIDSNNNLANFFDVITD